MTAVGRQGSSSSPGITLARIRPLLSLNGSGMKMESAPYSLAATSLRISSVMRASRFSLGDRDGSSCGGGGSTNTQRSAELIGGWLRHLLKAARLGGVSAES